MEPEFLACSCLCGAAEAVQPASSSAGDFVDRGAWGLETLLMLACWKMLLPGHFFLGRGNHECTTCTHMYGFRGELLAKFKSNKDFKVPLSPCTPLRLPPFFGVASLLTAVFSTMACPSVLHALAGCFLPTLHSDPKQTSTACAGSVCKLQEALLHSAASGFGGGEDACAAWR